MRHTQIEVTQEAWLEMCIISTCICIIHNISGGKSWRSCRGLHGLLVVRAYQVILCLRECLQTRDIGDAQSPAYACYVRIPRTLVDQVLVAD